MLLQMNGPYIFFYYLFILHLDVLIPYDKFVQVQRTLQHRKDNLSVALYLARSPRIAITPEISSRFRSAFDQLSGLEVVR